MRRFIFFLLVVFLPACHSGTLQLDASNPVVQVMPDISPAMQTPGYWISKTPEPDKLIMTPQQIAILNDKTSADHYIIKVSGYDGYKSGEFIKSSIDTLFNAATRNKLYKKDYSEVSAAELEDIYRATGAALIRDYEPVYFGVVVSRVSQKIIPMADSFYKNGNGYFDRLQMSSLDVGTPVAVLWYSADKSWLYVRSPLTVGWVPAHSVAFCTVDDIKKWEGSQDFVVAVKSKVSLYTDPELKSYAGWISLGVRLPLSLAGNGVNELSALLPVRGANGWLEELPVYINPKEVHEGYVPYTSRNMLTLAFELLNTPYGWGGMDGNQDCSGYIIQLFNSVGILMPRNSTSQGNSGTAAENNPIPGAAVIQFPGHIMLYIGEDAKGPYVIHAIWSYEELVLGKGVQKIPGRVVVSHLYLSGHTKRGPYINRSLNIRNIITISQ